MPAPITWSAGEVQVSSGSGSRAVYPYTTGQQESWASYPTGPFDETLLAPCLEALGLVVDVGEDGTLLGYEEPAYHQRSSAEEADWQRQIDACWLAAER